MNIKIIHYDICDSTNTRAKEYLRQNDADRLIITADSQSSGRGRQGKDFYSPKGGGLYLTYAFKTDIEIFDAVSVTTYAAAAVCSALEKVCEREFSIKWVNDIYKDGKKVCGILAENILYDGSRKVKYIIIGIGINVSTNRFPKSLQNIATSLGNYDKYEIKNQVIQELEKIEKNPLDRSFMDYYISRSMVLGKKIVCIKNGKEREAVAIAIDNSGGLLVQYTDRTKEILNSGEISLKLND